MKLECGLVIAAHGRHYLIENNQQLIHCVTRGKKSDVAVGDRVHYAFTSKDQGVIESIGERKTLLYRSDQYRSQLLAANVTQLCIIVATEPHFSEDLISRALIAAEGSNMIAHIILNKIDIDEKLNAAQARIKKYEEMGYSTHYISTKKNPAATSETLLPLLEDQTSILVGQSGMGKSSLINVLIPNANMATQDISHALHTGKHTTTFVRAFHINHNSILIDSPGFQEFGLHHFSEGMLERAFPEFRPYLGQCKFYNCHHHAEPGCAILIAVENKMISKERHRLYEQLVHESAQNPFYQ